MKFTKRSVSVLLLLAMLLSAFAGFAVSAEGTVATASTESNANYKEIVNLYELQGLVQILVQVTNLQTKQLFTTVTTMLQ